MKSYLIDPVFYKYESNTNTSYLEKFIDLIIWLIFIISKPYIIINIIIPFLLISFLILILYYKYKKNNLKMNKM